MQDFYARESKRGGAWMNAYVSQSRRDGTKPVVANHLNIPKPAEGKPTLLTWDEVSTVFHEFGHALHGMFSNVEYRSLSGTRGAAGTLWNFRLWLTKCGLFGQRWCRTTPSTIKPANPWGLSC